MEVQCEGELNGYGNNSIDFFFGSLSIVGVGFVKIPPQFYEKGSFYV